MRWRWCASTKNAHLLPCMLRFFEPAARNVDEARPKPSNQVAAGFASERTKNPQRPPRSTAVRRNIPCRLPQRPLQYRLQTRQRRPPSHLFETAASAGGASTATRRTGGLWFGHRPKMQKKSVAYVELATRCEAPVLFTRITFRAGG